MLKGIVGVLQRLQVTTTCAEAAFRGLLVAHAGLEVLTQQIQTVRRSGAEADRDMAIGAHFNAHRFTAEVRLVTNQGDFGRIRALLQKLGPQREGVIRFRCRRIHHQQHAIRLTNGFEGSLHADFLDLIFGIPQSCCIHHMQGHAVDVDMFTQHVAGRTGDLRHNGCFTAGQRVEQTGLARIGSTGNHHRHAIAQQGALSGFALNGG